MTCPMRWTTAMRWLRARWPRSRAMCCLTTCTPTACRGRIRPPVSSVGPARRPAMAALPTPAAAATPTRRVTPTPPGRGWDDGESLSETFTYTMQDADGDPASATLTITITGSNDGPQLNVDPGNDGDNDQVFEAGLATGSNAAGNGEFASGSFSLSDADGLDDLQSVTINGSTVLIANLAGSVFAGTSGSLTITAYDSATGVASYSYALTSPTSDGPGDETDTFSLSVSDGTASSAPATIVIEIIDDLPNAVDNLLAGSLNEGSVSFSGNVLSNDTQGADRIAITGSGAGSTGPVSPLLSQAGTYGTLNLYADGSYTYTLNPA